MLCRSFRLLLLLFLTLGWGLAAGGSRAMGQASTTASRAADLSVFGGLQIADPDYGPLTNNKGAAFGVDFTRFVHLPVQPSLELRANLNSGSYADERSYLFGLRGMAFFGPLQPYADFLVGPGDIHFPRNVGYVGDNSIVYNFGGGVELGVTHDFSLKLDLQYQRWNTGEIRLEPLLGTVGVTYHIPFHPHMSQETVVR